MAAVARFPFIRRLRSDASHHVIRYRNGAIKRSGRGLVMWFDPDTASIAEVPMVDREMTLFIKGRSADFQPVTAQGALVWRVAEPERLAERIDFSIDLKTGKHSGEPIARVEARLAGLASQTALQYLAEAPVRTLLDAGLKPLGAKLEAALAAEPALAGLGIEVAAIRIASIAPAAELERALQTPTFEALQQKADEATFERRALAVEKERAIAENELTSRTELARREKLLIAEETANGRDRATAVAEAQQIGAEAEARRIRVVEAAQTEAEKARMDVVRDLPHHVLLGLAARELAGKLEKIEHVSVTPDLLAEVARAFQTAKAA
jgi:SPFH domain / Band 7 family